MLLWTRKTVDILEKCEVYRSKLQPETLKRRSRFVVYFDPRAYTLPEEVVRALFPQLQREEIVPASSSFTDAWQSFKSDMEVYRHVKKFLDLEQGSPEKQKIIEQSESQHGWNAGVRGMIEQGVTTWEQFSTKWRDLGQKIQEQKVFVESQEFGEMMNYLNHCPVWREEFEAQRKIYDMVAGLAAFNYSAGPSFPIKTILSTLEQKGFRLTNNQLSHILQILHLGYRYLTTQDQDERKKLIRRAGAGKAGYRRYMVAIHALRKSEIHRWEELMKHPLPDRIRKKDEADRKKEKEEKDSAIPQPKNIALPADEFAELESALVVIGRGVQSLVAEVQAHREENARLLEEKKQRESLNRDLRKENEVLRRENKKLREEINGTRMTNLRGIAEANPHIRELWLGLNKVEEEQREREKRKHQLVAELPRVKMSNGGTSLSVAYHSAFEDDYVDLPKSVQEATLEAMNKILTPEFNVGFYQSSLQTKPIEGSLKGDSVTPPGSSESRATLKYRITHGYATDEATGKKVLVFYRVFAHP